MLKYKPKQFQSNNVNLTLKVTLMTEQNLMTIVINIHIFMTGIMTWFCGCNDSLMHTPSNKGLPVVITVLLPVMIQCDSSFRTVAKL